MTRTIIDCHSHLTAPPRLDTYQKWLIDTAGAEGRGALEISDDDIRAAMNKVEQGPYSHLEGAERAGVDLQLISPRPMNMMHHRTPADIVRWNAEVSNDLVYRQTQLWPGKFIGIASIPECAGEPIDRAVRELERCVTELGFRGCVLNPDPYENTGPQSPPLWDEYWYPLYEKLSELDVPCHVHGTSTPCDREAHNHIYIHDESIAVLAFISSDVMDVFPGLRVVVSHGGGSIPFQIGRYESGEMKRKGRSFIDRLMARNIYFDTVLHDARAVEYLIKLFGPEKCLFGTEYPGLGSIIDPKTGRCMDDLAWFIEAADWLTETEKQLILCDNAKRVFNLAID